MMVFHLIMFIDVCTLNLKNGECVIICLYVDDMSIFRIYNKIVSKTKLFLGSKFEMKDMDKTNMILGVKIIRKEIVYYHPKNNTLRNFSISLDIMTSN